MSTIRQLLDNPPTAWPLSPFRPEVHIHLHPEDPDWGKLLQHMGSGVLHSNPMPGLVASAISYFMALIAQHAVAHALPEGATRDQLLVAADLALTHAIADYGAVPHSQHPDGSRDLKLAIAVGVAFGLRDLALTLPAGAHRTQVSKVASRLGERATTGMFSSEVVK